MRQLVRRALDWVGRTPDVGGPDPGYQAAYDDVAAHTAAHRAERAVFWEAEAAALEAEAAR